MAPKQPDPPPPPLPEPIGTDPTDRPVREAAPDDPPGKRPLDGWRPDITTPAPR